MSKRLGENIKMLAGLAPADQAEGSVNGSIIDRFGLFDAVVLLSVGAASGTPTEQSVALKVQHGDKADGSDMADVDGAAISALTEDNSEAELDLDLNPFKRYMRVVAIVDFTGGTNPKIPVSVAIALGNSISTPI